MPPLATSRCFTPTVEGLLGGLWSLCVFLLLARVAEFTDFAVLGCVAVFRDFLHGDGFW